MGCSAAKNVTVEQIDLKESSAAAAGVKDNNSNNHTTGATRFSPAIGTDDVTHEDLENTTVNNLHKGANGLAFEIKFKEDEVKEDSIIQKHPPKRLLEIQESQSSPPTLQKLKEKLEEAEIRRQQILQQRVQSASLKKPLKHQGSGSTSSDTFQESPNHLKTPQEKEAHPPNPYDIAYF